MRSLAVEYVLNWGGFVNYSYRITDARKKYHLKVSTSPEGRASLARWKALGSLLERYHAPPVLDWVDLGPAAGLLFPFVAGEPPVLRGEVVDELLAVLLHLSADDELREHLIPGHSSTAKEAYLTSFHDRFTEDLRGIRNSRPPFVTCDLVDWLEQEAESLASAVREAPAFAEPLTSPVHGDLWLNNVLWVSRARWHLLDWDDVRIGDPVADLASLLGPTAQDLRPLKMQPRVAQRLTVNQRERLAFLGRATLLDWVIDPLSDWIDAGVAPVHKREVREEKERVHRLALTLYRQLFGVSPAVPSSER
jgi:hypothetical protein